MTTTLTPPASPLAMPTQQLSQRPSPFDARKTLTTWLARYFTFGGSLALTIVASWQMALTLPLGVAETTTSHGDLWVTALLWLLLSLFSLTFGWISLTATSALASLLFYRGRPGSQQAQPNAALRGKTVLLMPIYNEDAASACAALAAMGEDLARLNLHSHFEIFILSDSNKPDVIRAETAAVQCLRDRLADSGDKPLPVWYRRRTENTERKTGNIRDFINRWGRAYDYMVVLDADSLIAGSTLATLVREMDADPNTGIVQTLPRQYAGATLFARLQQFSSLAYGLVFARGLCAWQGDSGNYWGHNAIIRIRAFAAAAGLPQLPGPRPFGGEIRSHDFVEAALIRRAGWSVRMLPDLEGSWEECPPTLRDAAIRDRRWAQGNVQHLAVLRTRGLRWPSRAHMVMGVMNYLTSLLWLAMVTVGLVLSTRFALQNQGIAAGLMPRFDSDRMVGLFVCTMALLLLPKMLGLLSGLLSKARRGGTSRLRFFVNALVELLFSVLHAPIFMLVHSRHLWEIVRGQDSGWSAQRRHGSGVIWRPLIANHGGQTLLGVLVLGLLLWQSSALLYWMLPTVIGLILAVPLCALTGSETAGQWLARWGVLGTPEEVAPPEIMQRRQAFLDTYSGTINR